MFEGDRQPAQRPSWNYRKQDGGGIILDMLCPEPHALLQDGRRVHGLVGMMGDGIVDLPRIRAWMEGAGYRGFHEVEIFSARNWWRRNPDAVLEICKARHRRFG